MSMKARRLSAIKDLVDHGAVRSQDQLRRLLARRGFVVTQATLSRDIKALGLVKGAGDGAYHAAGQEAPAPSAETQLARAAGEYLLSVAVTAQLVVLKTGPGQAQLLALAVDRARLEPVLGTIAGDDTILVICRDARSAQDARRLFEAWAER
ncbi:MAG: arginine repressor [Acidobacteriota bacterium]